MHPASQWKWSRRRLQSLAGKAPLGEQTRPWAPHAASQVSPGPPATTRAPLGSGGGGFSFGGGTRGIPLAEKQWCALEM